MSDEQINIAIAEACGWRIAGRVLHEYKASATACWIRPNGDEWQEESLPDYCNDLNAMHEAEKMLTSEQVNSLEFMNAYLATPAFGTAAQRAEAFLRTLEKWEEAK